LKPIINTSIPTIIFTVIFSIVTSVIAHSDEYSTHNHGKAELTIAIEQNEIAVNFRIPAESLLGFEHSAKTKRDIAKVSTMKNYLSQPKNIIRFDGGDCKSIDTMVDRGNVLNKSLKEPVSLHIEILINYQFSCRNTEEIISASVMLIDNYSLIKNIHVLWVTSNKQGSSILRSSDTEINFQ